MGFLPWGLSTWARRAAAPGWMQATDNGMYLPLRLRGQAVLELYAPQPEPRPRCLARRLDTERRARADPRWDAADQEERRQLYAQAVCDENTELDPGAELFRQ